MYKPQSKGSGSPSPANQLNLQKTKNKTVCWIIGLHEDFQQRTAVKNISLTMSIAFWSATVKVGTPLEVQPPEGYVLNVQQAALVCENENAKGSMQVICHTTAIEGDALTSVIGTLRPNSVDQFAMALVFGYDVPVKFSVEGSLKGGVVHLSGYYQPGPDDDDEDDDEMEGMYDMDEDDEDDDEEDGNGPQYRKLLKAKGGDDDDDDEDDDEKIVVEGDDDDEDDDDDDDDEDDEVDEAFIQKMMMTNAAAVAKKNGGKPAAAAAKDDDSEDDDEDDEVNFDSRVYL